MERMAREKDEELRKNNTKKYKSKKTKIVERSTLVEILKDDNSSIN